MHGFSPALDSTWAKPEETRYSPKSVTPGTFSVICVSWRTNVSPVRSFRQAFIGWFRKGPSFSVAALVHDPSGGTTPRNRLWQIQIEKGMNKCEENWNFSRMPQEADSEYFLRTLSPPYLCSMTCIGIWMLSFSEIKHFLAIWTDWNWL